MDRKKSSNTRHWLYCTISIIGLPYCVNRSLLLSKSFIISFHVFFRALSADDKIYDAADFIRIFLLPRTQRQEMHAINLLLSMIVLLLLLLFKISSYHFRSVLLTRPPNRNYNSYFPIQQFNSIVICILVVLIAIPKCK